MTFIVASLALLLIVFITSLNWRITIKTILFFLVFEGALRKWLLPQASDLIYFLKDFLLIGAYLGYFSSPNNKYKLLFRNRFLNILVFLISGWCLFQVFNPSLGSPLVGLLGLRSYLLYIPLMWMLPNLFLSKEELFDFIRLYLLLTIPIGLLGIAQFFSPASSPINIYVPGEVSDVATFGSTANVRIAGSFSYIAGYTIFLLIAFGLLIPILSQKIQWIWLTIAELFLVVANLFMTGSRGVAIAAGLILIGYLFFETLSHSTKSFQTIKYLIIPILLVLLSVSIFFRPAVSAFWLRTTTVQDIPNRISVNLSQPFEFSQYKGLDGYGVGATHQAASRLRQMLNLPEGEAIQTDYYEDEIGRITLELGLVGFLLWYVLRISLLFALFRVYLQLQDLGLKRLALSAFLIQSTQIISTLVFNHTFVIYYWFLSGFIFLLPKLERVERWRQAQQLLATSEIFLDASSGDAAYIPDPSNRQS